MIEAVTAANEARFLALTAQDDCAGLRMEAAYNCSAAGCYLSENGALLLRGSSLLLCGDAPNTEELETFCAFAGVSELEGAPDLLPGFRRTHLLQMEYAEQSVPSQPQLSGAEIDEVPNLWQLASARLLQVPTEDWYADACARRNRGLAEIYAVQAQGYYVATAGIYALRENAAYLTAVATDPAHRCRGFARALLDKLATFSTGRTLTLLCEPELRPFYERAGYRLRKEVNQDKRI